MRKLSLGTTALAVVIASPAIAQTQLAPTQPLQAEPVDVQPSDGGLDEIVVTAQKRAENLQDVPISVVAISGKSIENLHATSLLGLQGAAPNLQISHVGNTPNGAVFTIRGIGVIDPDPYAGNTVAIVVDGVPQYYSIGALLDLVDIERIEVLRGPQGTLFGANTTGGVVNITTAQPTGEFGGKAELTLGNWNRIEAKAAINLPLVEDQLAAKVVFSHFSRDGWYTNIVDGRDLGGKQIDVVRGYLKFTPSTNFEATLIGEYDRSRSGGPVFAQGTQPGEAFYAPPGYTPPCASVTSRCKAPSRYYMGNDSIDNFSNTDTYAATLTMKLRDTSIGEITSITGYKKFSSLEAADQDSTPAFNADSYRDISGWQFSQELRTAISSDSLSLTAGVFYLQNHYDLYTGFRPQFGGAGLIQDNFQNSGNYSVSAFAQSYLEIADGLRLQAGLRYTYERTNMAAQTRLLIDSDGLAEYCCRTGRPQAVPATYTVLRDVVVAGRKSWQNPGWKVGIDYKVNRDVLLYGYWARGFKSGGFTGRVGIASDLGPFEPEKIDTFEGGVKTELFDRKLRLNLAGFYSNYRNVQLGTIYFTTDEQENVVQGNAILNAAGARIKGIEAEIAWVPVKGLTISGSGSYLDAKYREFVVFSVPRNADVDLSGQPLQNAPKWSFTGSVNYEFALGGGTAIAQTRYSYTAKKYLASIYNSPRSEIQPTHLVDASVEWTPASEEWSVSVWSRNLLDKRYIESVNDAEPAVTQVAYGSPREFGATFKVHF